MPPTFHRTVAALPNTWPPLGSVRPKCGPTIGEPITSICMASELTPPRSSRAVKTKSITRAFRGIFSALSDVPDTTLESDGKYRLALTPLSYTLNKGMAPSSAADSAAAGPRSRCSHRYFRVSLSPSDPEPWITKGVLAGTAKSAPALTLGAELVEDCVVPQLAPPPDSMKFAACSKLKE